MTFFAYNSFEFSIKEIGLYGMNPVKMKIITIKVDKALAVIIILHLIN